MNSIFLSLWSLFVDQKIISLPILLSLFFSYPLFAQIKPTEDHSFQKKESALHTSQQPKVDNQPSAPPMNKRRSDSTIVVREQYFGQSGQPDFIYARCEIWPASIRLSDRAQLKITIEGPASLEIRLPVPLLTSQTAPYWYYQLQESRNRESIGPERERYSWLYHLSPFQKGTDIPLQLQSISVQLQTRDQPIILDWDQPFTIEVKTIIPKIDLSALRPISGIEEPVVPSLPPRKVFFFPLILLFLLSLCLMLMIYWVYRKRYRQRIAAPLVVIEPYSFAWTIARLHQLKGLSDNNLIWMQRFSILVRGTIAKNLDIPIHSCTTIELISQLRDHPTFQQSWCDSLAHYLQIADRYRFMPQNIDNSEMNSKGLSFVNPIQDLNENILLKESEQKRLKINVAKILEEELSEFQNRQEWIDWALDWLQQWDRLKQTESSPR